MLPDKVSDLSDDDVSDNDTCDDTELMTIFSSKCKEIINKHVSEDEYILYIDGTLTSTKNVTIGLSNNTAEVYSLSNSNLAKLYTIKTSENVVGVKACSDNENLIFVGSKDCKIALYDIRDSKGKQCFKDTTVEDQINYKPLNCFDIASNNLLMCGGTDLFEGDAYILFWDIRNTKLLGAYWDSHTDDVTQVKFHSTDSNKLISGSTDGLINLYDLSQTTEDDALIDSLNTESSVDLLSWYYENNVDMISCIKHTNELQIWRLDDGQPYAQFERERLFQEIKRKAQDYCYIASTQVNKNGKLLALVGSNYESNQCLRGIGIDKSDLVPLFDIKENQQTVRCSWLNKEGNILVTGGEKGILNIWSVETNFGRNTKRKNVKTNFGTNKKRKSHDPL